MDLRDAVKLAKQHVLELFAEEGVANLGLEAADFDDQAREWQVAVGYSRSPGEPRNSPAAAASGNVPRRVFKVVRISDDTDQVLSVEHREPRT